MAFRKRVLGFVCPETVALQMHEGPWRACKNDGHQPTGHQIGRVEACQDEVKVVLRECMLAGGTSKPAQFLNAASVQDMRKAIADITDVWEVWLERADDP